jgi:uncharacterized protein (DUF2164 family)
MKIKLKKDQKQTAINHIQDFFRSERGEELGIIAAEEILDFFLEDLGAQLYNRGLDDARKFFLGTIENAEVDYDQLYLIKKK